MSPFTNSPCNLLPILTRVPAPISPCAHVTMYPRVGAALYPCCHVTLYPHPHSASVHPRHPAYTYPSTHVNMLPCHHALVYRCTLVLHSATFPGSKVSVYPRPHAALVAMYPTSPCAPPVHSRQPYVHTHVPGCPSTLVSLPLQALYTLVPLLPRAHGKMPVFTPTFVRTRASVLLQHRTALLPTMPCPQPAWSPCADLSIYPCPHTATRAHSNVPVQPCLRFPHRNAHTQLSSASAASGPLVQLRMPPT